jgi:hypothetical protein
MSSFKDAATLWKDIYFYMFDEKDGNLKGLFKDEGVRKEIASTVFIEVCKHPSGNASTGVVPNAPKPTWTECPKCHGPTKSGIKKKKLETDPTTIWTKCEKCNAWISDAGKVTPIIPREF